MKYIVPVLSLLLVWERRIFALAKDRMNEQQTRIVM